jgi:hypothetical protein
MRSRSIVGWRPWALLGIAILALAIGAFARACSNHKVSRIHIKLEDLPADKNLASNRPVLQQPLRCPAAGIPPLQPSEPGTGDHKVFLKWNASKPSNDAASEAVGYCLYRTTKKDSDAKKNPTCRDCEQINIFPVPGTACMDDLVKDGETYFYVAVAIAQNRDLSTTSNEIRVEIPKTKQPSRRDPPPGLYPACRVSPTERANFPSH